MDGGRSGLTAPSRPGGHAGAVGARVSGARWRRRTAALGALVGAAGLVTGCVDGGAEGSIHVLAAASLEAPMRELAAAFEDEHPDLRVRLDVGASSTLREQVLAGAPAEVVALADEADMDRLAEADAVGPVHRIATNELVLAVPTGNPGDVRGAADMARPELLVGLCAPEAPCGRLARAHLAEVGVTPSVDTEATDVGALLARLAAAELDVGIVYRSDLRRAAVVGIDLPGSPAVPHPIAVLRDARDPDLAEAFVALVRSPRGQAVLAEHGFGPP